LMIRTAIEETTKKEIPDQQWSDVVSPADVVRIYASLKPGNRSAASTAVVGENTRASTNADVPLWTPDPKRVADSQLVAFMGMVNRRNGLALTSYRELHAWSITHSEKFWDLVWDVGEVRGEKGARRVV